MDYSALDAIAKVAKEYKMVGKNFHLRFLNEDGHRTLAKGRGMLQDVASWRVSTRVPIRLIAVVMVVIVVAVADHLETFLLQLDKLPSDGLYVEELPEDLTAGRKHQYDFHVTLEETWFARQARNVRRAASMPSIAQSEGSDPPP